MMGTLCCLLAAAAPVDAALAPFRLPGPGDATPLRTALSNSFVFGGSNATLVPGADARREIP